MPSVPTVIVPLLLMRSIRLPETVAAVLLLWLAAAATLAATPLAAVADLPPSDCPQADKIKTVVAASANFFNIIFYLVNVRLMKK